MAKKTNTITKLAISTPGVLRSLGQLGASHNPNKRKRDGRCCVYKSKIMVNNILVSVLNQLSVLAMGSLDISRKNVS